MSTRTYSEQAAYAYYRMARDLWVVAEQVLADGLSAPVHTLASLTWSRDTSCKYARAANAAEATAHDLSPMVKRPRSVSRAATAHSHAVTAHLRLRDRVKAQNAAQAVAGTLQVL